MMLARLGASLLLCVAGAALAHHTPLLDGARAINKASRQGMLAQRMAKDYLRATEGTADPAALGDLFESFMVFDDQMGDLAGFQNAAPDLVETYQSLEAEWRAFKGLVAASPNRARALALREASDRLQEAAERNAAALARHENESSSRLVALAGRQRMLSQRIARDYLYRAGGIGTLAIAEEIAASKREFERGLAVLRGALENSTEIRRELGEINELWAGLVPLLAEARPGLARRLEAVRTCDTILQRLERVVRLYERR